MERHWLQTRVLEILKVGRMVFDGTGCFDVLLGTGIIWEAPNNGFIRLGHGAQFTHLREAGGISFGIF